MIENEDRYNNNLINNAYASFNNNNNSPLNFRFVENRNFNDISPIYGQTNYNNNNLFSSSNKNNNNYLRKQFNDELYNSISLKILRTLKNSQKYFKKLKTDNTSSNSKITEEFIKHHERHFVNFQAFLTNSLIPNFLDDHVKNLDMINYFFNNSLEINFEETIQEENEYDILEEIKKKIFSFNFSQIVTEERNFNPNTFNNSYSGIGLNNLNNASNINSNFQEKTPAKFKIFFGDNFKIKVILDTIEKKIASLHYQTYKENKAVIGRHLFGPLNNNNNFNNNNNEGLNNEFRNIKNPFMVKEANIIGTSLNNFNNINQFHNRHEENLQLIRNVLELRLNLNKFLDNNFIKVEGIKHEQLI